MSENMRQFNLVSTVRYEKEDKRFRVISASLKGASGQDYSDTLAGMLNEVYVNEFDIINAVELLCVEGVETYLLAIGEDVIYDLNIEIYLIDSDYVEKQIDIKVEKVWN